MTLPLQEASAAIARYDKDPAGRKAWAQELLGLKQEIGYLLPRNLFPASRHIALHAVGGMTLDQLSLSQQNEVLHSLRVADHLSVRDQLTQTILGRSGLHVPLYPDPAHRVAELFAGHIAWHGRQGKPAQVLARFPQGYLAVQLGACFGDDESLRSLAAQLDACGKETNLGIVFFRAGAAPWHDELGLYRRLAGFMDWPHYQIFESLDIWDICALLAQARAYCGSSLHGRIVALSSAVAGVSLLPEEKTPSKVQTYCSTWLPEAERNVFPLSFALRGIRQALSISSKVLHPLANQLADQARTGMNITLQALESND